MIWSIDTPRLTFRRSIDGKFQLAPDVCTTMRRHVQDTPEKVEAGGVLLGRHILGSPDIIVDRITTPMEEDSQRRHRYFRAHRQHQEVIDAAWQKSGGTTTYLGEWHTHPEPFPDPSLVDRVNWLRKLWIDQFADPIFFVIVGIAEIRVWEGFRRAWPRMIRPI